MSKQKSLYVYNSQYKQEWTEKEKKYLIYWINVNRKGR